ncbi:TDP1 [Symbiodinium natans]|uniref:TDP1 protein n=1 Tax=Symbiodinium natans TaxID=878477 RepID=A0A812NUZ5_9DINO|nr:TDP1 [Symbiodinium natans]
MHRFAHALALFRLAASGQDVTFLPACAGDTCVKKPPRAADAPTKSISETGGWGFSYGPLPTRKSGRFPNDDMMTEAMQGQWGLGGRDDIAIMAQMGARMVRLYGSDPRFDGTKFLNHSNSWGLKIVAGMSDYPYEHGPGSCWTSNLDCYEAIRESYNFTLDSKGFLAQGKYHPALDTLVLTNEPDLKFMATGGKNYMRAVLSAFDGVLAAETEKGLDVTSPENIKFTAAFSYSVCPRCKHLLELRSMGCCVVCTTGGTEGTPCASLGAVGKAQEAGGMRCPAVRKPNFADDCPGLPMIMDLHFAMEDPSSVGYTFRTQGWKQAFDNRWIHSFNGFVGANALNKQFIQKYMQLPFNKGKPAEQMIKVFMGEYGDPHLAKDPAKLQADLERARALVEDKTNPFVAFNFFEYEVAFWKPCPDPAGWDHWEAIAWDDPIHAPNPPKDCSERLFGTFSVGDIPVSNTGGIDYDSRNVYTVDCVKPIFRGKPQAVAAAYGGSAPDTQVCQAGWQAKPTQYCVASRGDIDPLGAGLGWACDELGRMGHDCTEGRPSACSEDVYTQSDWAFSMYFELMKEKGSAESICNFGGVGIVTALPGRLDCMAVKTAVSTTESMPTTTGAVPPNPDRPPPQSGSLLGNWVWWALAAAALLLGIVLCVRARQQPTAARTVRQDSTASTEFEMARA